MKKREGWHYPAEGDLPEEGIYVIGYFENMPWYDDRDDPKYKIVRLEKGISKKEREEMPNCERKYTYCAADEDGNNKKPYCWEEFGPATFNGQQCTAWHELPRFKNFTLKN